MADAKEKLGKFEELLKSDYVLVHINSRASGVVVPPHLRDNPALTLKLSYLFQGETSADMTGITTHLRFSGEYFCCVLPWEAVWGLTSSEEKQLIWAEDLPKELLVELAKKQLRSFTSKLFGEKDKKKTAGKDQNEEKRKRKTTSHLKLVK